MSKSSTPSIFYIYGNKTFEEEIKAACLSLFPSVSQLNIYNPNGVGFKVECFDINDLRSLDIKLEPYEGWIQQTRRNDFSDINADVMDFDKFIGGCNNRITFDSTGTTVWNKDYITYKVNAHKDLVAVRNLNFTNNSAVAGTYKVVLGNDSVNGGVPIGATLDLNRVIRKTLNGQSFAVQSTDASLTGFVIEYKGNEYRNYDFTGYPVNPPEARDSTYWRDNNITTRYDYAMNVMVSQEWEVHLKKDEYLVNKEDSMYIKNFNIICAFKNVVDVGHHGYLRIRFYKDGVQLQEEIYTNIDCHNSETADSDEWYSIAVNKTIDKFEIFVYSEELDLNTTFMVWDCFLSY